MSTVSEAILAGNRATTAAYIDSDPTTIALIPLVATQTDRGTVTTGPGEPREPQTFKVITVSSEQQGPTVTVNGVQRIIDHVLMGTHTATVSVGDHWVADGKHFEVAMLGEGYGYMTKALVFSIPVGE